VPACHRYHDIADMLYLSCGGITRVFYCTITKQRIVFLHHFVKKTDKTPNKELNIARQRMKEVKNG
jgi:phage-related protein